MPEIGLREEPFVGFCPKEKKKKKKKKQKRPLINLCVSLF